MTDRRKNRQVELAGEKRHARVAYSPPKLKSFGPVGSLTQGGTGMMAEMAGMMLNMQMT